MTSSKSRIRNAVSSSFIRRSSPDEEYIDKNNSTNIPQYAPFEEPRKAESINIQKIKKNIEINLLSKTEIKILNKINSLVLDSKNTTDPVYLDQLALDLSHPITTLKKTIQKLEQKGLIRREFSKSGRGGWTIYSITSETRAKLEPN